MSAAPVLRYRNKEVPRQNGEVVRLRVVKGPDMGITYIVRANSVVLGRGEEAGVLITDIKASRSHARLEYTREGWMIHDLGSANGILFQGEYVRKCLVQSGEHFTIGDTIFEFFANTESTRVLTAPARTAEQLMQIDQQIANSRMRVQGLKLGAEIAQIPGAPPKKTNPLLIVGVLAAAIYMYQEDLRPYYFQFMGAEDPVKVKKDAAEKEKKEFKEKRQAEDRELASYLPNGVTKEVEKTAEQYYRQGFREYREGNYLRAKSQFELALQVNPSHQLARHYLASAEHDIEDSIKKMIGAAQQAKTAGRNREAKGYYETAMRLMYYDRSNPDFVECEEGVKKINEELNRGP